jgi:Hemerythrin HHE cation binding domain
MDALELLKEDHLKVKELFEEAEGTEDEKEKKEIFEDIKSELEMHAHIEETLFYPAMEAHSELKDMVMESYEEHKQIKTLLWEISGSDKLDAKLKVLQENVEHHAEEEEEGKMFPQVQQLVDAAELEELGNKMEAEKRRRHAA